MEREEVEGSRECQQNTVSTRMGRNTGKGISIGIYQENGEEPNHKQGKPRTDTKALGNRNSLLISTRLVIRSYFVTIITAEMWKIYRRVVRPEVPRPSCLPPHPRRGNSDLEGREGRLKGHLVNRLVRLGFRLGHRKEVSVVVEKERKEESQKKSPAKHAHGELRF